MNYLTYAEYQALGGALTQTAFNRFSARADGVIDAATKKRIVGMATMPNAAKNAAYELIGLFSQNDDTTVAVASKSQSAGSVSESVSYVTQSAADIDEAIDRILWDFLGAVEDDSGTPLLYRGAKCV